MFKKSLASIVSAAVLVAGPGHLTLTAAAQTLARPVSGVTVTPTIGTGLHSPLPGASSFGMPALAPGAMLAPSLTAAPSPVIPVPVSLAPVPASLAARPVAPAAAKALPATIKGSPLSVIESRDAKIGVAEKGAALDALFENSSTEGRATLEVLGRPAASVETGLSRSEAVSARSAASIERAALGKARAAGSLSDLGNLVKRAWNAVLGMLGIGVKKLETPEVMAQRIIDQLNAAKPVYNRKVQEASTLVEKLKLQVEGETAKVAELEQDITALLSDSDPANDIMASGMINQQKTLAASIAASQEQIGLAEATLVSIKEERARFFSEREETIAKIQAGLTKSKAAEIQKQIAELKGGFAIGDLKDNMDRFEDAVNDKVADAKGTADSVDSNPDQILKKAKDSLKNQEVQDEIAKRKAAIEAARKAKDAAGGAVTQGRALGLFAKVIGIGFALISPWISAAVYSLLGLVAIAMAPEQGRRLGRQLAAIGLGTLVVGGAASLAVAKLGLTVGAFSVGLGFLVPAGIALSVGVIATIRANQKDGATVADVASTPAGASVVPAPVAAPEAASPRSSFSIKPLLDLLARAWNALLGLFGMGVKKMETPEILAQRLIDQLNDAKPVYNRKVKEASTLVEALRQQIAGEQAKIADFDKTITALLSDNDPANDIMAAGLLNSQKTLEASIAASKDQLSASEAALVSIKEERARFFSEREETLAKIQAGLTKSKSAEIQKQIAELKGGFKIGDLKDNLDRFDGAVNDKVADAKGAADSVESNPEQVLKKAKDSLRTAEIADELARRKAAIEQAKKDKGAAGGLAAETLAMGTLYAILAGMLAFIAAVAFKTLTPFPAMARLKPVYGILLAMPGVTAVSVRHIITSAYSADFGVRVTLAEGADIAAAAEALRPWETKLGLPIEIVQGKESKLLWQVGPKVRAGGLILELGIGAAVIAAIALVSKPFRNILARAWNAALGIFGLGVKKLETPEVMAQRIIDQLNAQKPVYNRKVQEASMLVEKLRLQIEKQEAQSADLDRSVTALLSDSDPLNDVMAESLLNQKKTVDASTVMTKEQLAISEKTLVSIKEERASFFSEREELLAKIQAGLTKSKAAEIQKQIAELKGGFAIGDLKDNMDRFEDAVNDKVADAKGTADSVDSNPDQILKKAKDSLKNQEVQDEIAKRKAAIEKARKEKGAAGGRIPGIGWAGVALGLAAEVGAIALLGLPVALPLVAVMGRAGLAAGLIGQLSSNGKYARVGGALVGALLATITAPGLLPIALGLGAGYAVSGLFADAKKPGAGIMDAIGAGLAGMLVGVTLPAWLGLLGAAKLHSGRGDKGRAGGLVAGGNIGKGLAVYALGGAFIAAVMGFVPGFAPIGILDLALRILGVVSIWAAMDIIEKGRYDATLRSMIMVGAGTATMLAAAGVFGALGGLTAIALGLTGFFFAWRGIARLASSKK